MEELSKLMISVSGVRGKIQDGFGPETILRFARAFAYSVSGDTVVVGRDSRPSGEFVESILNGAILASGKNVVSLGIVPTPTVKAIVNAKGLSAGVIVTASHNPMEWNAFKFVGKRGFFFSQEEIDQVMDLVKKNEFPKAVFDSSARVQQAYNLSKIHIDSILARIDVLAIRKKQYKVAIDAVNGAGSQLIPEFLEMLGCEVYRLHCTPDGQFPRPAEPTEEALVGTSAFVREQGVDIGFAVDPDADRLVVVTPEQGAISEEYTVPLCLLAVLKNFVGKPKVVVNESSSFLSDKIVEAYGGNLIRSKVGEANVVSAMLEHNAMFGGEGNGGVIDPKINSYGRDSLAGIGHILHLMATEDKSIDEIFGKLPKIYMQKTKFPVQGVPLDSIYAKLRAEFPTAKVSTIDGLRLSWDYGWVHIRPSNTEPIVRVIVEAMDLEKVQQLLAQVEVGIQK